MDAEGLKNWDSVRKVQKTHQEETAKPTGSPEMGASLPDSGMWTGEPDGEHWSRAHV
jgi:hypothetical protein